VRRGGELAHVQSELGDDDLGGLVADAGDLVQTRQRRQRDPGRGLVGVTAGGGAIPAPASGVGAVAWRLGGGDGADQLLDAAGQLVDLAAKGVDLRQ